MSIFDGVKWETLRDQGISALLGAILVAIFLSFQKGFNTIRLTPKRVEAIEANFEEMKKANAGQNSILLALAKATFATTKKDKEDAKKELLEIYSKMSGQ